MSCFNKSKFVGLIIIGNEILSGRTEDQHVNYIANILSERGILLGEVRIIQDDINIIIETVKTFSTRFDYVITTGGIGPTHDDITTEAISKTFGLKLVENHTIKNAIKEKYADYNEITLKEIIGQAAMIPENAKLIASHLSASFGFNVKNVFILAGVPSIMRSMMNNVTSMLEPGEKLYKTEIKAHISENKIKNLLNDMQAEHQNIEIGSYPAQDDKDNPVTSVTFRGYDKNQLKQLSDGLEKKINNILN